jgi:hypothetical protein
LRSRTPARFFGRFLITQVWISCRLAGLFFRFAFRFLEASLDFILCASSDQNKIARYKLDGCNAIEMKAIAGPRSKTGGNASSR